MNEKQNEQSPVDEVVFGRIAGQGSSADPFDGQAPYFREIVREKRLNLILHLASYSEVLLVQGEAGSGRSRFLARIHEHARSSWRSCLIVASPSMSHDILEEKLRAGLELPRDEGSDSVAGLRRQLTDLQQEHLSAVVLIDNADALPDSALALLSCLVESRADEDRVLSLVLVTKPGFPLRLMASTMTGLRERVGHVFDVPPFTAQDTFDYIHHCLRAAGAAIGPPFTMSAMRLIYSSSAGSPAAINPLARRLFWAGRSQGQSENIVETKTDEVSETAMKDISAQQSRRPRSRFVMVLVVLALAAVWWQQEAINRLFQAPTGGKDLAAADEHAVVDSVEPLSALDSVALPSQDVSANAEAVADVTVDETPLSLHEAMMAAKGAESAVAELPAAVTPESTTQNLLSEPASGASPKSVMMSQTAPLARQPDEMTVNAPLPGKQTTATLPSQEVPVATARTGGEGSGQSDLSHRPAGHFTLQLIALAPVPARQFVRGYGIENEAVLVARGPALLGVLYGDYARREDARKASKQLRQRIPQISPWIRRLGDIQAEMKHQREK